MDLLLIDKRVVERNIEKGTVTRKEYEAYCAELPDLEEDCEKVEVSLYKTGEEEAENSEEGEAESPESFEPEGQGQAEG